MKNKFSILLVIGIAILAVSYSARAYYVSSENLGASVLRVYQGGTGSQSFTSGECLVGNGTGAITTQACGSGGGDGGSSIWSTSTPDLIYYNNEGKALVYGATATTSNALVEIVGDIKIGATGTNATLRYADASLNIIADNGTNDNTTLNVSGKGTGFGQFQVIDGDTSNSYGILSNTNITDINTTNGEIRYNVDEANFDFRYSHPNDNYLFMIDGSANKVGIGTATPSSKFTVVGGALFDNATTTSLGINSETFTDLTGTGLQNTAGVLNVKGSDLPGLLTLNTGNFYIGDASNNPTGTTSLFMDTSGNVGIGTTVPSYKLDVNGTIQATDYEGITYETIDTEASTTIGDPTHIDTWRKTFNHTESAGVMHNCAITNNGDGTINIGSGYALLRASSTSHQDLYHVEVQAQNNIAISSTTLNYIIYEWNSGTPQWTVGDSINDFNCQDACVGYIISLETDGTFEYIDLREQNVDSNRKQRRKELETKRFEHVLGGSVISSSNLDILVTAGAFWYEYTRMDHDALDTTGADTFDYYYTADSGSTWTKATGTSAIDNTQYNDITSGLTALGVGKYKTEHVYVINNNPSRFAVVYGQTQYTTVAGAQAAPAPSTTPNVIDGLGALIGRVIVQQGNTDLTAESTLDQIVTSGQATTHNGLSGIQGGTTDEYYHFTSSEHTELNGWLDNVTLGSSGETTLPSLTVTGQTTLAQASSTMLTVSGNSYLSTIKSGVWNGTSITDAYIDDNITASNYLALTAWYATTTHSLINSLPALATVGTITSGTWNGTAIDISDYTNLVAGTNITLSGDTLNVDDSFLLNTGDVGTGVYDFGGATSLEIPNGASPTVDTQGEIAIDTTADQFQYYGTSTKRNIPYFDDPTFCLASTTLDNLGSGTSTQPMGYALVNETFNSSICGTTAGTADLVFSDGTNLSTFIHLSTTPATTTLNYSFSAGESREVQIGNRSGIQNICCTIKQTFDNN